MQRNPARRPSLRALAALSLAAWLAVAAAAAGAAAPEVAEPAEAIRRAQIERWKGRVCTRPGCTGVATPTWSHAVAFGATLLLTGWIARRQPTRC